MKKLFKVSCDTFTALVVANNEFECKSILSLNGWYQIVREDGETISISEIVGYAVEGESSLISLSLHI
jgi:hypothetical protein